MRKPKESKRPPQKMTKEEWMLFQQAIAESDFLIRGPDPRLPSPMTPEKAKALDKTALAVNLIEDPDTTILKVRNTLGLPLKKWNDAKMRAIRELGQYEYMKICARVLLVTSFSSVEEIEAAIALGKQMMADTRIAPGDRVAAGTMISKCAEALSELGERIMELAQKGSDKAASPAERPKNLPPIALQVNVTGVQGPAPAVAISGKTG